jgi:PKD repeat protein
MKKQYFLSILVTLSASLAATAQTYFWTEAFDNSCTSLCTSYTGPNGAWTFTSNGPASACGGATTPNIWYISCAENGTAANGCGTGCGNNASLHVGNDPNSPSAGAFCPTGDCGAAYDAGGFCDILSTPPSTITDIKAASPTINCTGRMNISVSFNYIEFGQGVNDNATLEYFDGTTWSQLVDMPKTACCGGNCNGNRNGLWATYTIALPASANNNPNVAIAFRWVNDDDGTGTDPSFAVDSVQLSIPGSVILPTANFSASATMGCDSVCVNFTDQTIGNPTSWLWDFPGAVPSSSAFQNPTNICYYSSGTYTVTLTATNSNGSDSIVRSGLITVTATPLAFFTTSNQNICAGDCISFADSSTNSPTVWSWIFAGATTTTSSIQNPIAICYDTSGTYPVELTVSNGACANTSVQTNYINVQITPVANFSASAQSICVGDCIDFTDLSTNSPSNWQWLFQGGTPATSNIQNPASICYNTAGQFTVTLVATTGLCSNTLSVVNFMNVHQPAVPTITQVDLTLTASSAVLYQWFIDGDTIAGAFNQTYNVFLTGFYHVCTTDGFGCTACSDSVFVLIEGLDDVTSNISFNVYPVPSSDNIFILSVNKTNHKVELAIEDVTGRIVHHEIFSADKKENKISIAHLTSGIYLLRINSEGDKSSFVKKIVKN